MNTHITTAHQSQVARLGSALHASAPRRRQNDKPRSEYDRVKQLLEMAQQRYTQRYAADILGLSTMQAYRLCKKYDIQFCGAPRKRAEEEWK